MAINPALLVSAAMLQDYLVDKTTGKPLANGLVSLYKDEARTFYKNWYYQTGTPGAYTYIPLDNPMHLSSVGTIQDPNGNDVIPFYYPFEENNENVPETYYITVYSVDRNGDPATLQFTRENFPFVSSGGITPGSQVPTFRNYILNNVYWRNIGTLNATDVTNQIIAPSQHEGLTTNSDIRFIKSVAGATDTITFFPMTQTLQDDITPEVYLNVECSDVQLGETQKCIQYPIALHVDTLQNVQGTIVFHGQNVSGSANNFVNIYLYQFLGTGALVQPAPILLTPNPIVLGNTFQKFTIPFTFPGTSGLVLGLGGDDGLFLLIQYPLSLTFNINHTKPQLYLSANVPDNDFDTYDQIETIINSPRTGDFKTSLNDFQPWGFVPASDGSIGNAASSATIRANIDTWPLYNLLWNKVLNNWAPVSSGRGANAISDFNANKTMTLTRNLGRIIAGLNAEIKASTFTTAFGSSTFNLTLASTSGFFTGSPVQLSNTGGSLPSGLTANSVYFVILINSTTIQLATTVENAYSATPINIGSDQTGTSTVQNALGAYVGESLHTLSIAEMPSHNHPGSVAPSGTANAIGQATTQYTGNSATFNAPITIAPQGGGAGHNTIQPTSYLNVFIKL
jgi:hypothetical protein